MTRLTETVLLNEGLSADAIDEEGGVIKGVSLLGRESKNGRRYSPKAMQDAARLYEGAIVNIDHRMRSAPSSERGFMERGGVIRNARVTEDGTRVRGDFHYLKSQPSAAVIVESAKRFPASFGFSHDAEGDTTPTPDGMLVEGLSVVHSLDIVGRPATNAGLFESEDTDAMKIKTRTAKQILESAPSGTKGRDKLARLLEVEAIAADMPIEAPAEADPAEEVKAALEKAAVAVLRKWFTGEMEEAAAIAEIKKIYGMSEDAGGDSSSDVVTPEMTESIRRLETRLNIADAKALLLESNREATPERVEAVAMLSPEKRKRLVESWPAKGAQSERPGRTGSILESYGGEPSRLNEVFGEKGPSYLKFAKKA